MVRTADKEPAERGEASVDNGKEQDRRGKREGVVPADQDCYEIGSNQCGGSGEKVKSVGDENSRFPSKADQGG